MLGRRVESPPVHTSPTYGEPLEVHGEPLLRFATREEHQGVAERIDLDLVATELMARQPVGR
jgi:hypothetical protein